MKSHWYHSTSMARACKTQELQQHPANFLVRFVLGDKCHDNCIKLRRFGTLPNLTTPSLRNSIVEALSQSVSLNVCVYCRGNQLQILSKVRHASDPPQRGLAKPTCSCHDGQKGRKGKSADKSSSLISSSKLCLQRVRRLHALTLPMCE